MKQPVMFAFFSNQSDYIDQKTENRTDMKIMYITIKQKLSCIYRFVKFVFTLYLNIQQT